MKLLVHACCGPCSLEPHRLFVNAGCDVTLAYLNSNIHPQEEYLRRLETLRAWADSQGASLLLGEYDPLAWENLVGIQGSNRENRCRMCYRMRFEELASIAKDQGYDAISTTLSVSPYQFTELIAEELQRAADAVGIEARFQDFRDRYPDATRRSRELGMYRQNYCGCHFSNEEAAQEREESKAARKAAKATIIAAREKAREYCAEKKKEMEY